MAAENIGHVVIVEGASGEWIIRYGSKSAAGERETVTLSPGDTHHTELVRFLNGVLPPGSLHDLSIPAGFIGDPVDVGPTPPPPTVTPSE